MRLKANIAVSESGFIFDPNSGDSFTLNQVAREILDMLKKNKSDAEISNKIIDKYDVDEVVFEQNYYDFLAMLSHFNLLKENEL